MGSSSTENFQGLQTDPDQMGNVRNLKGLEHIIRLVRCGNALVKLSKSHANPHGVLQELLGAAADTRLLLLVQRLPPECVNTVLEARLHQRIVHP